MDVVVIALGIYFGVGLVALGILEVQTGRIRGKLHSASLEAQNKLLVSGNLVGGKTSRVLVIGALWLFWPVAIYGALSSPKEDKPDE